MTYAELAAAKYTGPDDLNCSESMLVAANEAYDIGLDEQALRVASPFGGGMGVEGPCGALTGSLMALGAMRATDVCHRDAELVELRDEFVRRFRERFGSLDCREIKTRFRDETRGCEPVVAAAGEILEELLGEPDPAAD